MVNKSQVRDRNPFPDTSANSGTTEKTPFQDTREAVSTHNSSKE